MKVTLAIVKLQLRTCKVLSDGTHPIVVYCAFHGKRYKSTGYSCTVKHWDKKNECVKKGYPNYAIINQEISRKKQEVLDRRHEYELSGAVYTVDMLLSGGNDDRSILVNNLDIKNIFERYCVEKNLSKNTIIAWNYMLNTLYRYYNRNLLISEISRVEMRKFEGWMVSKGIGVEGRRQILSKIRALQRYSIGLGLIDISAYAFHDWVVKGNDESKRRLEYVHPRTLQFIKQYMMDLLVNVSKSGESFGYDDYVWDLVNKRTSKEFALFYWVCGCCIFQGLSPVDFCLLKKDQFKVITENGKDYWSIVTHREKTGMVVRILIDQSDLFCNSMVRCRLLSDDGDYFLPVLNKGGYDTLDKQKKGIDNNLILLVDKLRDMFNEVNKVIIKHNVDSDDNVPVIDDNLTMYSYRHSFAMSYMLNGGTLLGLGTRLGHGKSLKALASYVALLTKEQDLVASHVSI